MGINTYSPAQSSGSAFGPVWCPRVPVADIAVAMVRVKRRLPLVLLRSPEICCKPSERTAKRLAQGLAPSDPQLGYGRGHSRTAKRGTH